MIFRYAPDAALHDPDAFFRRGRLVAHPESSLRYETLLSAVAALGDLAPADDHGAGPLAAVHDGAYLDLLEHGFDRARAADPTAVEALPTQFPSGHPQRRPEGIAGQLGWHMTDTSTPLRPGTWRAVYGAAQAAVCAADDALAHGQAYALCRPPGHHASAGKAGGFCYLNNAAIAAERLRASVGRVAIVDIDVHHGNGTQAIFYDRPDVLFVSVHADTTSYFPYFSGYADERGAGAGVGFNLNLPLPLGTDDDGYARAIAHGLESVTAFDPHAIVVSLGLDPSEADPIGAFAVTTAGFARAARLVGAFKRPTVLIQEGGYATDALTADLSSFLTAFNESRS